MMLLQRAIEVSENKEMSVQDYLSKVIKVVSVSCLSAELVHDKTNKMICASTQSVRSLCCQHEEGYP